MLSSSQPSKSISENNRIDITKIAKWSNFEQELETFIKDEIDKNVIYQKPNNINNFNQLEYHFSYKMQIWSICSTIFSQCLFRNIKFVTEVRENTYTTQIDICCLKTRNAGPSRIPRHEYPDGASG